MQGIGKEDCQLMMQVINLASVRGCLRADDLYPIGILFEKLKAVTEGQVEAKDDDVEY